MASKTFYVGPREHILRLYDKRQERIDRQHADESHPESTRVEVQLRNLGGGLAELSGLPDPFVRFAFVDLTAGKLTGLLLVGASYASTFGVPALRALGVSPADVRTIARNLPANDPAHPSRAFAEQWPAVVAELLRRLGVAS